MARITKSQLKEIYHKVDNRITGTINRLGSSEKIPTVKHPVIKRNDHDTYVDLIKLARKYDIEDFFVLQKNKARRKLRTEYRIVLRSYEGIRDSGVFLVKKLYKLRYDR
tara:strand:- start:242 stop:568 length:327 start_codon:yes stop_codon:yes gene_type:complete